MRHRELHGERRETCRLNSGLPAQPLDCPSHPLHHPEPARCQWQAVPADGGVLAGGVHRPPDSAANIADQILLAPAWVGQRIYGSSALSLGLG